MSVNVVRGKQMVMHIYSTVLPAKSDSDVLFLFTKLSGTYNR